MKEWFTTQELLDFKTKELPDTKRGMIKLAEREGWNNNPRFCRKVQANGGVRREYHYRLLPSFAQSEILYHLAMKEVELRASKPDTEVTIKSDFLWKRWNNASEKDKKKAQEVLCIVEQVEAMLPGIQVEAAVALVSRKTKVSIRTIHRYRAKIAGLSKGDWLAACLPFRDTSNRPKKQYDERIWDQLVALYMRVEEPSFTSCYDIVVETAQAQGWGDVPSIKTLKRRLDSESSEAQLVLARKGVAAAVALYPAQQRNHTVFHAMETVNSDGHVMNNRVIWEDGEISRPVLVGFQDIYSGLVLSHRIDRSENKEMIRLSALDMVREWGIPEIAYLDNGRAFMSKAMTGRMKHRFRFKIRDEDPEGLFTMLETDVRAVLPYRGQSKPIERAWGDMAERISKHPKLEGSYTGMNVVKKPENYGKRAIPIAEFRKIVAKEIMRHNTREGRQSLVARGRSFAQVFKESIEHPLTIIRKASSAQLNMFKLAGEAKQARKGNGEIHLADNRYWAPQLVYHAGKKLIIRFDPENLHEDLMVYTLDNRFICAAECIDMTGFNDVEAAKTHARNRKGYFKSLQSALEFKRRMELSEAANLIPDPEPMELPQAKIIKMSTRGRADNTAKEIEAHEDHEEAFSKGIRKLFPVDEEEEKEKDDG